MAAPSAGVAHLAPATIVFAAGGTRRAATLAGIDLSSAAYPAWSGKRMLDCFNLMFSHGVRHIISPISTQTNFSETTGGYREKLLQWIDWGLTRPEVMAAYFHYGWRARLIGSEGIPELAPAAAKLRAADPAGADAPTIWFTVASSGEAPWEALFAAVLASGATTRAAAIRACYGADIPPADMFIGFGKPELYATLAPPLLIGKLQCYWRQSLGYEFTRAEMRAILYDYAYLRQTWRADKSSRANDILVYQDWYRSPPVIGLGRRLGPFWFPAARD